MSDEQSFKRINFFKGFVTTTQDWNDAERYHVEKRKLHNKCFHGAGVVLGYRKEFSVNARGKADMSVEISPGYAIDGEGNDIILWETEIKTIDKADFKLPLTIYFVAKYAEEFTDFIAYKENLDFKGHRRIAEKVVLDVIITEPDIKREIELARVFLTEDVKKITDARDPFNPGPNEIDKRFVPTAGVVGGFIPTDLILRLVKQLRKQRNYYYALARDKKLLSANSVALGFMTLELLLGSGVIGPHNIMPMLANLGDLENDMIDEIESTKPSIKAMKDFGQLKHSIDVFRDILRGNPTLIDESGLANFESLDQVITVYEKADVSLAGIVGEQEVSAVPEEGEEDLINEHWAKLINHSGEFPENVMINNQEWTLIDTIDVLNKDSEDAHNFQIQDTRDSWRTRQRIRYPDGVTVEDAGIAHEGGYTAFEIHNVTPNRPLMLLRRMDYVRGDYEIEYDVNDVRVGVSKCTGFDRRFRWRNWPFLIPAEYVTGDVLKVIQKALTADRDINMFRFWFYQAL